MIYKLNVEGETLEAAKQIANTIDWSAEEILLKDADPTEYVGCVNEIEIYYSPGTDTYYFAPESNNALV